MQTNSIKNHYVVCGAGRVGQTVAELLRDRHTDVVVVDSSAPNVERLKAKGFTTVLGNALEESVLREAGIERARGLIAVLPESEKNIVVTLSAKQLNPELQVYARAEQELFVKQLHTAGAQHVVLPEVAGAKEIVREVEKAEGGAPRKT